MRVQTQSLTLHFVFRKYSISCLRKWVTIFRVGSPSLVDTPYCLNIGIKVEFGFFLLLRSEIRVEVLYCYALLRVLGHGVTISNPLLLRKFMHRVNLK